MMNENKRIRTVRKAPNSNKPISAKKSGRQGTRLPSLKVKEVMFPMF